MGLDLAIPYIHMNRINIKTQEFNINYDKDKNDFGKLITFVQLNKNKRINILLTNGMEEDEISTLTSLSSNLSFVFDDISFEDVIWLKENKISFYLSSRQCAANWKELFFFVEKLGVSQVYIADDLVYNLAAVKKYLDEHSVKLRVVLNEIPETTPDKGEEYITPVYRPEEKDNIGQYYDVGEFILKEKDNREELNLLFDTWNRKKKYSGDLKNINKDLKFSIININLPDNFCSYKMNCQMRCKNNHSVCRKCEQYITIANTLAEKGLIK